MLHTQSKNPSVLDTKFREFGFARATGDIGIEVELEGKLKGVIECVKSPKFWDSKPEGSLRNGVEYVLHKPVSMEDLPYALEEFEEVMNMCTPKKSIRCSTHIHVNINNLTIREIYNILGYYYLIEEILVQTQGPTRMGNLFCLRMSDAENTIVGLLDSVQKAISINVQSEFCFGQFNGHHYKYGAMNLAALCKFGSLEFRFLLPMTSKTDLALWSTIFYTLVHQAKNIPLKKSLRKVEELSPIRFLELVFPKSAVDLLTDGLNPSELEELVMTNYDHIWNLKEAFEKDSKLHIPSLYLMNDLSPTYGTEDGMSKTINKPKIPW